VSPQNDPSNGGKRKPPKSEGRNARERARIAAAATARRRKRRRLGIIVLVIVVVVVAAGVGIGYATNFGKPKAENHHRQGWGPVKIEKGKPITLGKPDAPVTLTLYEDFRCPHCAEMEKSLGPTITDLQKSGRIKVHQYVLPVIDQQDGQHGSARAGNAMACAAEEGFGEPYRNGLFDNYGKNWTSKQLIDLANQVDKPKSQFTSCVKDMKHKGWVESVSQVAQQHNVNATPTVFINGHKRDDAPQWSPQQLRDAVKKASK
jgi:protein-disulfide isomerase